MKDKLPGEKEVNVIFENGISKLINTLELIKFSWKIFLSDLYPLLDFIWL